MKVSVCQIDPRVDKIDDFLSRLTDHIAKTQADFVLLPEMGFSDWLAADPVPDAARWMQAIERHDTHIATLSSLGAKAVLGSRPIVNAAGSPRNQAYIWDAITKEAAPLHEKYYLPEEPGYWESRWYDRGPKSFDTGRALGAKVGVQICTEMWFFEWARHFAKAGVDLLCVPRGTPHETSDK